MAVPAPVGLTGSNDRLLLFVCSKQVSCVLSQNSFVQEYDLENS